MTDRQPGVHVKPEAQAAREKLDRLTLKQINDWKLRLNAREVAIVDEEEEWLHFGGWLERLDERYNAFALRFKVGKRERKLGAILDEWRFPDDGSYRDYGEMRDHLDQLEEWFWE